MISEKVIHSIDQSGMFQKILEFPKQLVRGWEIGEETEINLDLGRFNHVVLGGMGGSAIGGDIVRSLLDDKLHIPFVVNRGYQLPGFCNEQTLFIASSYSGNTEETLASFHEAVEKGCSIVCMTSGGQLHQLAKTKKFGLFQLPEGYPPRAALGYGLGILLCFFHKLGIRGITDQDLHESASFLEEQSKTWGDVQNRENMPYALAQEIRGRIPLIYSSGEGLEAVGFRWKTQLNENSKTHAFYQPFSEMNHNEIVGWQRLPDTDDFLSYLVMVLLRMPEDHPRIRLRMDITKELAEDGRHKVLEVVGEGPSKLCRLLDLIYFGDFVSFYLAVLYGADPTEIKNINFLKSHLSV